MTSPPDALTSDHDDWAEPTLVRLAAPGELVASLPALLGYHAERSIVLIMLSGQRGRVVLTMRLDLPDSRDPAVWSAVTQRFMAGARSAQADEAILVLLDGDEHSALALHAVLGDALGEHGVGIRDVLVVADGRYRSILCDDGCCPAEGTPVPGTGAVATAAVASGRVIHANREELRAEIAEPDARRADRGRRVLALLGSSAAHGSLDRAAGDITAELETACAAALDGDVPLDQAARLAWLVRVGDLRDEAYHHLVSNNTRAQRAVWASVCRQLPPEFTAVPHVLFAVAAYLEGEGALANVAMEVAGRVEPDHPAVTLMAEVLEAGITPDVVRAALARSTAPPG